MTLAVVLSFFGANIEFTSLTVELFVWDDPFSNFVPPPQDFLIKQSIKQLISLLKLLQLLVRIRYFLTKKLDELMYPVKDGLALSLN
jgi:hypothetical protein